MATENKGCAFAMKGGGTSYYYASPAVKGFADFVRFLYENQGSKDKAPRPIPKRIPQAIRLTEAEWHDIADNNGSGYSCFIKVDIQENQVWVNEDIGDGMAIYFFPFTAVMKAVASGGADIWKTLLKEYPSAKIDC